MENIKTKIAIFILIILIIALIVVSYLYSNFNNTQMNLLTSEANKILETNLKDGEIDLSLKTEDDYAKVEKSIKEYLFKIKNIYVEMEQLISGINPNTIFSVSNMPEKNLDEIDNIIEEYKEKCQNLISEYEELIKDENIKINMENYDISSRKEYYFNLYNDVMLSDVMKKKYNDLEDEIKNEKASLYDKLNKIEKIKDFLEEYDDSWTIKGDKIQFTNLNRMTEYYNLFNQVID